MATLPTLELVSFDVCPYVQRSVITLKHKGIPFQLTFIDLDHPPEWFDRISPLGKVPLLKVSDGAETTVLFESAIINEYLDEITPPRLAPADPLARARERGWIEVSSDLLGSLFGAMMARESAAEAESLEEMWSTLARVEAMLADRAARGSFFRGTEFGLVDAAFAPVFWRLALVGRWWRDSRWQSLSRTRAWAEALNAHPAVRESVIPDFNARFAAVLKQHGSPLANEVGV